MLHVFVVMMMMKKRKDFLYSNVVGGLKLNDRYNNIQKGKRERKGLSSYSFRMMMMMINMNHLDQKKKFFVFSPKTIISIKKTTTTNRLIDRYLKQISFSFSLINSSSTAEKLLSTFIEWLFFSEKILNKNENSIQMILSFTLFHYSVIFNIQKQ
mgnify:CR=1 FL=1